MSRIWVNGCFDLLHIGHIQFLQEAQTLADHMIVWFNSDTSLRKLKGDSRPIVVEAMRRASIAAVCKVGTAVWAFEEENPIKRWEACVKSTPHFIPDLYAKDEHFFETRPPEYYWLKDRRVKMVLIPRLPNISTTSLIHRIRQAKTVPGEPQA
jgi:cytidyltransferase-like protein